MEQVFIKVSGRVQGVRYRATLAQVAASLGLKGYVENKPDGTVELLAQGPRQDLNEILKWSQKGSFLSKVEGMSFEFSKVKKEYPDFELRADKNLLKDKLKAVGNLGARVAARLSGESEKLAVPQHIVIIPDGNRRWAREKGWKPWVGHKQASQPEQLLALVKEAARSGIKYVTFWAMSTENWSRDQQEVKMLFQFLKHGLDKFSDYAMKYGIRLQHLGRKDRIPADLLQQISDLEKETEANSNLYLQVALDYGGQDELLRALNKIHSQKQINEITAETVRKHLDASPDIPDPDLIIRTSGEQRTSGALLWQSHYAEFYFSDVYFPDFGPEHLRLAILDYSFRTRRFGGTAGSDTAGKGELSEPTDAELAKLVKKA
jgi:undecaprenyl diphosphate synthase